LTRRQRTIADCYSRVAEAAASNGWAWPSKRTIERRVKNDISRRVRVLMREGAEALDRMFPAQRRARSVFHAMEAVNGDGVEFHPKLKWADGTVSRAKVWFWQDLYSGYQLAWRADVSENKDMLRLAYGDLVERYGIPAIVYIDNTVAAASKWLTGGTANRYRWKIKDEDPLGIMPQLGSSVRFVTPGHGQSKPIERSFQDLRQLIDRNPRFEGRGTEARPIPVEEFLEVLEIEVQRHNAKEGRRTDIANGRSFEQVFFESYEQSTIRRATESQRKLWLLAAERVRADTESGAVRLGRGPQGENRYWMERMPEYAGQQVVVRFDPQRLHESVHVYTTDGTYVGEAACTWRAGFNDTNVGRAYHRHRARWKKHTKKAAEAERGMNLTTAIEHLSQPERPDPPEAKVVAPQFPTRQRAAVGSDVVEGPEDTERTEKRDSQFAKGVARLWEQKKRDLI
ncbi:MAG TPA: transposase domain-containing protein, partial [Gammaproteobacteria bacterium]|nr:transposase domain-containing protein [Gammaproteobacteria bacterium]